MAAHVLSIVAIVFAGDLAVLAISEGWWSHRFGTWTEILVDDLALSAICAAFLAPLVRRWRHRARIAERAMDIASDGFLVVAADGRILRVNDGYCTITGQSRAALLGQRLHELQADATAPSIETQLERLKRDGVGRIDTRHRRSEGAPVDVQVTMAWMADTGRYAVFVRDDSARVSAERALLQSAQRLQDNFELAPVGMTRTALDGRFTQVNTAFCRLLDEPHERLMSRRWQDITHDEDRASTQAQIDALLRGPAGRLCMETRYRRANGSLVWVQVAVALVRDEAGGPDYVISVVNDISTRKESEAAVRAAEVALRANAAKTEFLSRMSHELRTPLNAVLGYAQLLRMDRTSPLSPGQAQRVQHIERGGTHLLALIDDVLDLSRIESGRFVLSPEEVDLRLIAEESIAIVSGQASAAGVSLHLDKRVTELRQRAMADRVRLKQVLINLLSNAIKYNRPGGAVDLGWTRQGDEWKLQIADTGHGMNAVQLAHLFEPFNRLGAEKTAVEGTGIGLALSRHLVQLMGGRLHVDSEPGRGTIVTLTVCAAADDEEWADADTLDELSRPVTFGSLRVLYAEDNEVNVELVRAVLLSRPEIDLRTANDGKSALAAARADPPDLMLVDMHLGDMTGLELGRALLADPRTAGIRLVALSADAVPERIQTALDSGFEAYLIKPIDFKRLLSLLADAAGAV